jgi:hypothetical protein
MGYSDNPFNSSQGKELMKDIFNLMFVSPEGRPSKIEEKDKTRQVTNYRANIVNIVNKMRKFVKGYQQVIVAETASSGIHVCPHCRRRDAIWMWETVDAGHYASPAEWLSSVTLTRWNAGMADERGRYQFVVRYRCNDVTTCKKCHISVGGHFNSCQDCSSSDVVKAGCGEESFATHFIREYTADDNHPQVRGMNTGAIDRNREIRVRRETYTGTAVGYDFQHTMIPDGKVVREWEDIKKYTPYVRFTYEHYTTKSRKTEDFPVSELNFAVSKQNMIQCVMGKTTSGGGNAHNGKVLELKTSANDPVDACPYCQETNFPALQEVQNLYYRPRPMLIMNEQPLSPAVAQGGTFRGQPVYTLYLESPVSDAYKLLLPLPQLMSLRPIPNEPQVMQNASQAPSCPNDVGGGIEQEEAVQESNEEMQKLVEERKKELTQGASQANQLGDADGQTNAGFTFDVCEGRSKKAYYDSDLTKWIDDSPPCKSYRKDGTTLTKSREYPRWSQIPSYSPHALPDTFFNEYLGPNPDTHMICDWIKANQILSVFSISPPLYHAVQKIAETIQEDVGLIYEVLQCETCKGIVESGGIIPYRKARGQCDDQGIALNNFPQKVLDAEMALEQSFPTKNLDGEPVPTGWGIVASKDHNGRKMLLNPNLNIRIG